MDYDQKRLTKVIQHIFIDKRRKLGLTQEGLSMQSQVTRQFISQVESGKRAPSIFTMSTICSACHLTFSQLFQEMDDLYHQFELEEMGEQLDEIEKISEAADKAASENKSELYIMLNAR